MQGAFTDRGLLARLARRCEVLTFDWETVAVASLRAVARLHGARICPPIAALAAGQDRVAEKRLFERLGIPTTRWRAVSSRAQLTHAIAAIGLPGVLKTRRLGYDGKGQAVIRTAADARRAWRDRKSTRLNSSHDQISYAVFCLKKKNRLPSSIRGAKIRSRPFPSCGLQPGSGSVRCDHVARSLVAAWPAYVPASSEVLCDVCVV